jgi:hypothetical protein
MSYKVKYYDEDKKIVRKIPTFYNDINKLMKKCLKKEDSDKLEEDSMFNLSYLYLSQRLTDLYCEEFGFNDSEIDITFRRNKKNENVNEFLCVNVEHI